MNNPDPVGFDAATNGPSYYNVQKDDCLWNIALEEVQHQRKEAGLQQLKGRDLEQATAAEMRLIFEANPQIVGRGGSGTYDLIYPGDKINIPNSVHEPGVAPQAGAMPGYAGGPEGGPQSPALVIPSGTVLERGETYFSPDGRFRLVMQGDGNLVLYRREDDGEKGVYATGTYVKPDGTLNPHGLGIGHRAVMRPDGNLIVYDEMGKQVWESGTAGNPNAQLAIQDNGNLVIYGKDGQVWDGQGHNDKGRLLSDDMTE